MKNYFLFILASLAALVCPQAGSAQVAPALGTAARFALFTAVGAVSNTGPTFINGDFGTNAGAFTGFPPGVVNGSIRIADTYSTQAATDVQTAYGYMSTIPCVIPLAVYGGTPAVTLAPGSYCVGASTTLAGTLILDGGGNPNAKFFLRVSGAFTTGANSVVLTQNGATPANVYWQIGGMVTLGQNSVMRGTLLVDGAINMIEGATLIGRGLSRSGAITMDSNTALVVPVATSTSWLGTSFGAGTTNWFTASNWSNGVPTSQLDAVVPANATPYPIIASGNALVNSLTIDTGASLTMTGGTLNVKAGVSNSGNFSATAGTTTLSGTATQIIGGTGSTQFWSLSITNPAGVLQRSAVSIHGVLAPTSGNLTTNGHILTLLSDAAGTALVNNAGTGTVNGAVTVQRFIAAGNAGTGYHHYSSPVSGSTVADLTTTDFSPEISQASVYNTSATPATTTPFPTVFGYDQSRLATTTNNLLAFDKGFVAPTSLTTPLVIGQGYAVNLSRTSVVDFVGSLTTGNQTVTMTRNSVMTPNASEAGWQLLGNPYPSPLDYSLVAASDRAGLDAAIYVYASSGPYVGAYRAYANGIGGNSVLPIAQGFFARVSSGQTTGTLIFRNKHRLTTSNSTAFQRKAPDTRPLVELELRASNGATDLLYAYAQTGATLGFDTQFDARKLLNPSGLNLVSVATTGETLAIDGRPVFTAATLLPLTLGVPAAGTYSLAATTLRSLPDNLDPLLTDATTGQTVNLRLQSAYTFSVSSAQATGMLKGRFTLGFTARTALAATPALTIAEVTLYPNPAHDAFTVQVPAVAGATQLHVDLLNILGQAVRRQDVAMSASGARLAVDATGLAPGLYILRLQIGAATLAKRVVIQ
ncbi:DUF3494 domain-containing protein [Hymenobacter sp. BT683]|uniref:DUF3494 domain-containing protein n=1 Tax=Hymenobacter jeongseonensis TaxID=2791027 RepID=A0ABS0INN7_9BACT|nr:ice-binding family protein [Hymenobacter jeongseonensis]MBF9239995.1 DUF3494 domain-containing protein [Hymenobacter jeongseonensis]